MADAAALADARLALACLDLTSLNDGDDAAAVAALCARATTPWGPVAAVCVWPRFVAQARRALPASIRVAAVADFPDGAADTARAVDDARRIVDAGGDEVDLVLPWLALLEGRVREATAVVAAVRDACAGRTLKLILESGELPDAPTVQRAARLGLDAGVDFLKTSTGKTAHGATPEAAAAMLSAIAAHPRRASVGFKASGGIRTVADAARYAGLVRQHLGPQALSPSRLRFGASGLLADIERVLGGGPEAPAPASGY